MSDPAERERGERERRVALGVEVDQENAVAVLHGVHRQVKTEGGLGDHPMPYHVSTLLGSNIVHTEAYMSRKDAERKAAKNAEELAATNLRLQEQQAERLRRAVLDLEDDDREPLLKSLRYSYTYRVDRCSNSHHCMACLEAGFDHAETWPRRDEDVPCACLGSGFLVMNEERYEPEEALGELQACDCGIFETDDDAIEAARAAGYIVDDEGLILSEPCRLRAQRPCGA